MPESYHSFCPSYFKISSQPDAIKATDAINSIMASRDHDYCT